MLIQCPPPLADQRDRLQLVWNWPMCEVVCVGRGDLLRERGEGGGGEERRLVGECRSR